MKTISKTAISQIYARCSYDGNQKYGPYDIRNYNKSALNHSEYDFHESPDLTDANDINHFIVKVGAVLARIREEKTKIPNHSAEVKRAMFQLLIDVIQSDNFAAWEKYSPQLIQNGAMDDLDHARIALHKILSRSFRFSGERGGEFKTPFFLDRVKDFHKKFKKQAVPYIADMLLCVANHAKDTRLCSIDHGTNASLAAEENYFLRTLESIATLSEHIDEMTLRECAATWFCIETPGLSRPAELNIYSHLTSHASELYDDYIDLAQNDDGIRGWDWKTAALMFPVMMRVKELEAKRTEEVAPEVDEFFGGTKASHAAVVVATSKKAPPLNLKLLLRNS